jgi:Domain of unknown function (DUF4440)
MADVCRADRRDVHRLDTFDDLFARWVAAEARGDTTDLRALLDAEFRGDDPRRGLVLTRDEWLARYRTGGLVYRSLAWEDVRTEVNATTAVAMGMQVHRARYQGRDWNGRFPATLVAVRREDRWRVVNLQLSGRVDEPG